MTTAMQLGLVPGFALQDGDLLAKLLSGGIVAGGAAGGFGLGATANTNVDLTNSSNANVVGSTLITGSVTVVMTATATGNSLQLAPVAPLTFLRIFNESTQAINIYPPTGQSADIVTGAPAPINAGVQLSGGVGCDYLYLGSNQWITDLLGGNSQ